MAYAIVSIGSMTVTADHDGKYELNDVEPGTYTVSAKAPFPGYEPASQEMTLAAGEIKVVDLHLDFEKTLVHGYVYGADHKPLAGAAVSGIMSGKDVGNAVTDDKGLFKFDKATPGSQFIRVTAPGYVAQTRDFSAKRGERTKLEFNLVPSDCKVHGTVLDENDRPLVAQVALSSESGVILERIQSDAETGHFEFAVIPGTYNLLASGSGYLSKGWRGSISTEQKVDLKLQPIVQNRPRAPA